MTCYNTLADLLSQEFNHEAVKMLVKEYTMARESYRLGKWDDVVKHSGMFSEAVIGIIAEKELGLSINYNNINFGDLFKKCLDAPKKTPRAEVLLAAIPQVAKSVYTLRSQKKRCALEVT